MAAAFFAFLPSVILPVSTAFIDARVATGTVSSDMFHRTEKGRFVIGVAPDKKILFGYPGAPWSSYTSISIAAQSGNTLTIYGAIGGAWHSNPVDSGPANSSTWAISGIKITQKLSIVKNPVTNNNFDTIEMQYIADNRNPYPAQVGVRIMLDLQLAGNDNSPIIVQGFGRVLQEQEWTGSSVPDAWYTLDDYYTPTLRAQGTFITPKPDRLLIGQWDYMKEDAQRWTYTPHASDITDTAVAVFWDPVTIPSFTSTTFTAYFGIQEPSGAELIINKTVSPAAMINYGDTLSYHMTYSNLTDTPLTNLVLWDTIPWNTTFVDAQPGYTVTGSVISWALPDIPDNSTTYSRWFRVALNAAQGIQVLNMASAEYIDTYWNDMEVRYSNEVSNNIATLTPSASPTISATHTISPTHSITPTWTITPTHTATPPALMISIVGPYPNPAKVNANIVFNLTSEAEVKIRIYTLSGEFVVQLEAGCIKGNNSIKWNLKNRQGNKVSSGTYLYALEARNTRGDKQKAEGQLAVVK